MPYTPYLEIGSHWRGASTPPYLRDLMSEAFWNEAGSPPGQRTCLRRDPLSSEFRFIDDPLAGQIPFKPRMLSLDYQIAFRHTRIRGDMAWLQPPLEKELEQRQIARDQWQVKVNDLFAKGQIDGNAQTVLLSRTSTPEAREAILTGSKLNEAGQDQLAGGLIMLQELAEDGTGFLEEIPDFMDAGASGVRWNFAVPNVEKVLLSSWELQRDEAQCFRLRRAMPLPQQERPELGIYLSNGTTQYGLVFTKEESVEFRHYRKMTARRRRNLEDDLREVMDTGMLTLEDKALIGLWHAERDQIKKKAKQTGLAHPIGGDATRLVDLQELERQLKESKSGLTDAMTAERERLETLLFYKIEQIALQEDTRSLYETVFDVTISFHRKGFIGIRIGNWEPYFYEVQFHPDFVSGDNRSMKFDNQVGRPMSLLPAKSRIMIRSNGGAFGLAYGNPDYESKGTLYGQPFDIYFPYIADEWSFQFDAIGVDEAYADPLEPLLELPGVRIVPRIEVLVAAVDNGRFTTPTKLRLCLDFYSDKEALTGRHRYTPELYRCTVRRVPGAPVSFDTPLWRSDNQLVDGKGRHPLTDSMITDDEHKAAMVEVFIRDNKRRPAGLPIDIDGRWARYGVINDVTGQKIPVVGAGMIKKPEHEDVRRFIDGFSIEIKKRMTSSTHFNVVGIEEVLNRVVEYFLEANGQNPGDFLREFLMAHGLPEEYVAGIPAGNIVSLPRFPQPTAGMPPDLKAAPGETIIMFIRSLVMRHCRGWRFRIDPILGCTLELDVLRERPDLMWDSNAHWKQQNALLRQLAIYQDQSDYWTEATFIGGVNPLTGRRFSSTFKRWEATERPGSIYYVGLPKIYTASVDETIKSQVACDEACVQFMTQFGRPPYYSRVEVWWRDDLKVGHIPRIDGLRCLVENINRSGLHRGMEQRLKLTVRWMDEIMMPIYEPHISVGGPL